MVLHDNEMRIWDPTASWWVNSKHVSGYSGALALRLVLDSNADAPFRWGAHQIVANEWHALQYRDLTRLVAIAA